MPLLVPLVDILRVPIYSAAGLERCPCSHTHRAPATFQGSDGVTWKQILSQHTVESYCAYLQVDRSLV